MSVKNRNSIVTDGLVFYVDAGNEDSYAGSGTTWSDLVGSDDGTFSATPTTDSANGGSIVFDGTDDTVSFTEFSTSGLSSFTLDVWVYIDDDQSDGTVIGQWGDPSSRSFLIWWDVGVTANFRFIVQNPSAQNTITSESDDNANNNDWNHVVATFDSASQIKLYVNNVLTDAPSHASTPFTLRTTSGFEIGDDSSDSRWLDGKVSSAKIYNRVLSASEVTQNYNALKNRFI